MAWGFSLAQLALGLAANAANKLAPWEPIDESFVVDDKSTRRAADGKAIYFCCEACARHFDANIKDVHAKRGW